MHAASYLIGAYLACLFLLVRRTTWTFHPVPCQAVLSLWLRLKQTQRMHLYSQHLLPVLLPPEVQ